MFCPLFQNVRVVTEGEEKFFEMEEEDGEVHKHKLTEETHTMLREKVASKVLNKTDLYLIVSNEAIGLKPSVKVYGRFGHAT